MTDDRPGPRRVADREYMARAIRLARLGRFTTDPNPRVGCVLVRDGRVVGEGWHRRAGGPHAERHALAQAGAEARGATAYVTLEPCSHHGRTPPCADAMVEAGVARVVCAMVDPNPLVAGRGLARLGDAGIETSIGVLEAEARSLNSGFVKRMEHGLPYVRCKMAASLDGRTAMADGESRWISSAESRRDVQSLRAGSSAILTGIGTVLADDPSMNVRLSAGDLEGMESGELIRQPLRVVVDSRWRMPADARMLGLEGETLVVGVADAPERMAALESAGASVWHAPRSNGRVDLRALMAELARREINEVMLESGPNLAGAMLEAGLVDEIQLYLAPHLMGDAARGLFHLPGISAMADRLALEILDARRVGPDLRLRLAVGGPTI
ncbi:bifunctional diaminohydroxyphosphoribosylaminopyrimidine deaminase/5-amino-6-(5-phosphoribosylamino)uracil reductase RibD [Imhoffiella purpurea]|uniref:Riboflavin biosynthesis protein RibD n=1 Tax=Imhoffiella purpurea TaxID=1249627 RepID=W9VBL5_9GAMM|nr:bifunctional diaminohydroxyphosphoribosylaminopyrimidine deaminase/5-amino-6-(5-phosphoribosylamino)uracil reductase RibD [Imhoffiella purpurea]EXJ16978.1 Diaminohydroxyphosphoribosylaminopyrimidine deaminase [Imhoffiella purpurea]